MKSPSANQSSYTEADRYLGESIDSSDLVSAYNANPVTSKQIAARIAELRHDGILPTRRQLRAIIHEENALAADQIRYHQERIRQEREAAELAKRQQHPLYNTLYRNDLIQYWNKHGQPPAIPPLALSRFTNWIIRHADATEDDVREMANTLEKSSEGTIREKLGELGDKYFSEYGATPITARNLRRTLRAAFRQCNEQVAHILGLVRKGGQEYVSTITKKSRAHQLKAQARWISASKVSTMVTDDRTGKEKKLTISLGECLRTAEHRFSELYALMSGQESYFVSQGYVPVFITATTPAEYHPSPSLGENSWTGLSVIDSHEYLTENWQHLRAILAKHNIRLDGFRVAEAHKDGAEHWHIMLYVKKNQVKMISGIFQEYFGQSKHAVKIIADFTAPGAKWRNGNKASAAAYMLKYIVKAINRGAAAGTSAANDASFLKETDANEAWRSTWNIRAFQFFGVLYGKQTLWRELRRLKTQPEEPVAKDLWRHARGGRAHHFIATLVKNDPRLATIHELSVECTDPNPDTGEVEKFLKKGRIVGVQINSYPYIAHEYKWELETDYSLLTDGFNSRKTVDPETVTVIPKYPRRDVSPDVQKAKSSGFGMHLRKKVHSPPGNRTAA